MANVSFDFVAEDLQKLQERLEADLNGIVNQISTDLIPLSAIETIEIGYFNPTNYPCPSVFVVPSTLRTDSEEDTYNEYGSNTNIEIYIVCSATSNVPSLFAYQLYNYVKAIVAFLNSYSDEYELVGDGIEFFEALGADDTRKWAQINATIKGSIKY